MAYFGGDTHGMVRAMQVRRIGIRRHNTRKEESPDILDRLAEVMDLINDETRTNDSKNAGIRFLQRMATSHRRDGLFFVPIVRDLEDLNIGDIQ
jgi:hypothetical protein